MIAYVSRVCEIIEFSLITICCVFLRFSHLLKCKIIFFLFCCFKIAIKYRWKLNNEIYKNFLKCCVCYCDSINRWNIFAALFNVFISFSLNRWKRKFLWYNLHKVQRKNATDFIKLPPNNFLSTIFSPTHFRYVITN